jgi:hypothetical protein
VVSRVVVDQTDVVFVEEIVEFFVDGIQGEGEVEREAQRELEKERRVAEEGFVDVEGRRGR